MVKKRKNDTRIDPFATAIEGSSLDALLESSKEGDVISMPAPSDPSRQIRLTCRVIPNQEIEANTQVFGKNRRVQALLTEKSVADIMPAIKADGRNQHPALCWQKDGVEQVLAGSRRRKACILSGADYLVLSSPDFNEQDAKILAVSSDQYIAPSLWELGQAYWQTKQDLIAEGKKGSYREIAELESVSHTAVADAIKAYEKLPKSVLALYPTANFVGREVAKKLIAALDKHPSEFMQRVEDVAASLIDLQAETDEKTALNVTKALTEQNVSANRKEALDMANEFVSAQRNLKTGDVTLKLDHRILTPKRLEQLTKLLHTFN